MYFGFLSVMDLFRPFFLLLLFLLLLLFFKKTIELYSYCFVPIHLQMIESSAHGDDYDGVIFSQLVRKTYLWLHTVFHCFLLFSDFKIGHFFPTFFCLFSSSELDWFGWIGELKNWNNWIKKKGRILHQQKSSDTRNCRCYKICLLM